MGPCKHQHSSGEAFVIAAGFMQLACAEGKRQPVDGEAWAAGPGVQVLSTATAIATAGIVERRRWLLLHTLRDAAALATFAVAAAAAAAVATVNLLLIFLPLP